MENLHLLQASKPLNNVQLEGQTSTKSEQGFQFFMSEQTLIRNPYAWPVDTQPSWHGGQHHSGPRHVIWRILFWVKRHVSKHQIRHKRDMSLYPTQRADYIIWSLLI